MQIKANLLCQSFKYFCRSLTDNQLLIYLMMDLLMVLFRLALHTFQINFLEIIGFRLGNVMGFLYDLLFSSS